MKNIRCQGIDIPIKEKLFVNRNGCSGEVFVAEDCPNAGNICNGQCKNCYGTLAVAKIEEFDHKRMDFIVKPKLLTNSFFIERDKVTKILNATDFINSCEIISRTQKDRKNNSGAMTSPWYYGDRPITWATDCAECKIKYKDSITPCKNIDQNRKDGKSDYFCGEQKQRILAFY